jgi:peptidoglycan/LPS O-acetylase OafA/YrhL
VETGYSGIPEMGILRLLLASLVLASHVPEFASKFLGPIAVECFYVISGFYIQMILIERYIGQPQWRRKFLESRLLRIYVPYWLILTAFCILMPVFLHRHDLRQHISPLMTDLWDYPTSARVWLTLLANVFILGTEYMKLFQAGANCGVSEPVMIPQVWSIGIELTFYFIAPFLLLCRTLPLISITLASIVGKFIVLHTVPGAAFFECGDVLLDDIFPLELCLFATGALGYRFYARHLRTRSISSLNVVYVVLLASVALATAGTVWVLKDVISGREASVLTLVAYYAYVVLIAIIVPFLFKTSRMLSKDRFIGDLSYSFYLCHVIIINKLSFTWALVGWKNFIIAEIATLVTAVIVVIAVEIPLNHFRDRHFHRAQ